MFEKKDKEHLTRLVCILLAVSIAVLALSLLTSDTDGRRQIIDRDGGSEEQLCSVLSRVEGAGTVEVMVEYSQKGEVKGVIVLAEGGSDPVVANNLTNGVATLYSIPVSSVIVFERKESGLESDQS